MLRMILHLVVGDDSLPRGTRSCPWPVLPVNATHTVSRRVRAKFLVFENRLPLETRLILYSYTRKVRTNGAF